MKIHAIIYDTAHCKINSPVFDVKNIIDVIPLYMDWIKSNNYFSDIQWSKITIEIIKE